MNIKNLTNLKGLQRKIVVIVLIFALGIGGVLIGAMVYQSHVTKTTFEKINVQQEDSIINNSYFSVEPILLSLMYNNTSSDSRVIDSMFSELKTEVKTLQTLATQLFENGLNLAPHPLSPPNPSTSGRAVVEALSEEGVDFRKSKDLSIASNMSETMIAMDANSKGMLNCYFGLADGTYLLVDKAPADKFDENGNIKSFPVRERPWYKGAIEKGDVWFSEPYEDAFNNSRCITCSAPVYADGRLVGVVGVDMQLDAVSEYMGTSVFPLFILNSDGQVLFSPEGIGNYAMEFSGDPADLFKGENAELSEFIKQAMAGPVAPAEIEINGSSYYVAGIPLKTIGGLLIAIMTKSYMADATDAQLASYREINNTATNGFVQNTRQTGVIILLLLLAVLIIGTLLVIRFSSKVVRPLQHMTDSIDGLNDENLRFSMEEEYRTGDEVERLARSFSSLSERTLKYIDDIQKITAERERAGAELKLATNIQFGMLPKKFPAFPDHPEIDIHATMDPAKEVGGDFYDFFLIDDDHLALVIADVSGKGVPAALFMMSAMILVKDHAMIGGTPSEILTRVNQHICANNEANMFVTVWLGILELSTGHLTAANAGHEYPMFNTSEGYEMIKDKHGPPIGIRKKSKYTDYEMTLKKGDSLFVYTDGVAEATDADGELFGTERTVEALNSLPKKSTQEEILKGVRAAVDGFVKEAPQFDDITMLGLKFFGKES